ncbi:MAG: carbon starvation protein A [Spirochaetes bacterium]|nr:carbon starvation protein A [Spirochaetota bacterium]
MNSLALMLLGVFAFLAAYLTYGRYISKKLGIDPERPTPAHTMNDGVDYVPAKAPVLLGHHFASIAGAAPIIGPIVAAVFGWIPVAIWIFIGGIFMGAVHDFSALITSVRHGGRSIGEVIENEIGKRGKFLFLIFSWSTLILVVAVFIIVVSRTFEEIPSAASASTLFIAVAVLFGLLLYRLKMSLGVATIIGVVLLAAALVSGYFFPLPLSALTWSFILMGYIFVASVAPVWILLQPRDYLNSFILYTLMGLGVAGIVVVNPEIKMPAFTSFHTDQLGYLFPILFVTVACGAISGFHSLVASGTSAKQLNNEKDARPVGYGAMLIESLLAIVALITAAVLLKDNYMEMRSNPVAVFAHSLGNIMTSFGIPYDMGKTFSSLAVSAFALTSLDTATRLARFALQEFFHDKDKPEDKQSIFCRNRYLSTLIGVIAAGALVISGEGLKIWPIFGSANQLLAALALLAVTIWLTRLKRATWFVKIPMVIMFIITLSALGVMVYQNIAAGNPVLAGIAAVLFLLAVFLAYEANRSLKEFRKSGKVSD